MASLIKRKQNSAANTGYSKQVQRAQADFCPAFYNRLVHSRSVR